MSAALPSGSLFFLFSDIEGSTHRWDAYGDAMRDALRRHDAILRAEIERRNGYVFKTIGDAFCAAFAGAGDALGAAAGVQLRLSSEDFRAVDGVDVRMAIHAGETDERDGDYFGTVVNRTARLLSVGHGGQVLVSGDAARLAEKELPPHLSLRMLGRLPLRDLKEPEQVYQLIGPGLRSEFKALRALQTPPNNLPRQTTSFVGRAGDVANLAKLLGDDALITLVGAGGMGKTRLALEAAFATINDRADGAWFVDLSAVTDAGDVLPAILTELGVDPNAARTPLDALLDYFDRRELLLILDNCEQVVGEVAAIASAILARCAYAAILATSREPLAIAGERVYAISSLELDAAMRLFADRAIAANAAFSLDANRELVSEVCRRLDGIALAIELAAARVRTMPMQSLAEHLELRMLAGGRDRGARQQTMRALIDWSYDLLAAPEQSTLRASSVFAGGFTLAAATHVCAGEPAHEWSVLERLASLVEKSLLVLEADGEPRYRLLEPIREYAYEKLEQSEEAETTSQRHARAFGAIARAGYEEWETDPKPDWLDRLERELSNLRVALGWTLEETHDLPLGAAIAADTAPLFLRLSLLTEGIEWCERALQLGVRLEPPIEGRLRYGLSMLYTNAGANRKVLPQAQAAAELFRAAGARRELARALSQAAEHLGRRGDAPAARAAAAEALEIARGIGDKRLLAATLQRCASAFAGEGIARPRELYAESVALFRALRRDDETARALTWWAQEEAEAGQYDAAAARSLEARELASRDIAMHLTTDIACYYLLLGDRESAEPHAREALQLAARAGHPLTVAFALTYLAALAGERNPEQAARLIGYAEASLRTLEWERREYDRAIVTGLVVILTERLDDARVRALMTEGAQWSEERALVHAAAL